VSDAASTQSHANVLAERAAWFACGVGVAWTAHWFKYVLPGRSPAAVVALLLVALVVGSRQGFAVRWRAYACGALALGACVIARPWVDPQFAPGWLWCKFDGDAWRDADYFSEARLWMIDDYMATHSPVGRPLAEVDALLGEDDLHGREHTWTREWVLGSERGLFRIDSETLVVEADEHGLVTKVSIYRD
jgi:hypothetical protein